LQIVLRRGRVSLKFGFLTFGAAQRAALCEDATSWRFPRSSQERNQGVWNPLGPRNAQIGVALSLHSYLREVLHVQILRSHFDRKPISASRNHKFSCWHSQTRKHCMRARRTHATSENKSSCHILRTLCLHKLCGPPRRRPLRESKSSCHG
jgi:hypothetical protein